MLVAYDLSYQMVGVKWNIVLTIPSLSMAFHLCLDKRNDCGPIQARMLIYNTGWKGSWCDDYHEVWEPLAYHLIQPYRS